MNRKFISLALVVMLVTFAASFSFSIFVAKPALARCGEYTSLWQCEQECYSTGCCSHCVGSGNCWSCVEGGPPCC